MSAATSLMTALLLAAVPASAQTSDRQRRDMAQQAYRHGQELMQRESFEEAARQFRRAIELDPMHYLAHYDLGQTQMALKHYPEAVEAYRGCRDVFAELANLDAREQNELEREREDEIRELKDSLQRLQSGKVKTSSPFSQVVQLQERLRVLEGTRMRGKEQLMTVPGGVMLGLGSAYFRTGQMAEAEAAFREAVQSDPELGPAHNNLAVMYMMGGRFDDAREEIRRAEKAGTPVADAFKKELERRARESRSP